LVCFGSAELGVQVQGMLPLAAGLLVIASGVVAFGEALMCAGLQVGVAGLGGQPDRCLEVGAGGIVLAGSALRLRQSAERQCLAVLVASQHSAAFETTARDQRFLKRAS
jgi:hypothetical protein